MELIVNGEKVAAPDGPYHVAELLRDRRVEKPDLVSVQLNGAFLDRDRFASTALKAGDEVDFLYFMGGGRD